MDHASRPARDGAVTVAAPADAIPPGLASGGGAMGDRIRAFDWATTPLGPIGGWPPCLTAAIAFMLNAPTPMLMLWGADGTMIYNQAYAAFIGDGRPGHLGCPVQAGWPDFAPFNGHLLRSVLGGGTLQYRDFMLPLNRAGTPEDVWMDLSYSPVFDDDGHPVAVMAIIVDRTAAVLAQRRVATDHGRLAQLFEQSPTFMALLGGTDHRFELVNPGYRRLIGDREVTGMTVAAALPDAVEQGYLTLLDQVYRTGEAHVATAAAFTRAATVAAPADERMLDFVFQPVRDAAGAVTGIFVQGADVTERVAAERERRDGEARLRFLDDLGQRIMPLDDAASVIAVAGKAIAAHLGASICAYAEMDADENGCTAGAGWAAPGMPPIAGRYRLDDFGRVGGDLLRAGEPLVVRDAARELSAPAAAAFAALDTVATICIPLIRDGRLRALMSVHDRAPRDWSAAEIIVMRQVAARCWAQVERVRAQAALRDLNATLEARVAERAAALHQSKQTIRTVFENSFMDQTLLSTTGEVVYVNATALAGIDAAPADVIGRAFPSTPWFAGTPDAPDRIAAGIARAAAGENVRIVLSLRMPTGMRAYEYSLRPACDEEGQVVAIVSEAIEITARLQAEEALRQAQKMEAVGQLTGGLAHDFNNLLAAIGGNLELMERRIAQGRTDDLARYIDGASQGARRAAALTQRLLAFSRRQTLDPKPTDADRLIADMTDLIRQSAGPGVAVTIETTPDLWPINVDASQLENALLNLCINARDAMAPGGGALAIRTDNIVLGQRDVLRRDVAPGDYVRISVIDGGTGMPPEVIERAFDPFFTTKPIGEGTGLGLSMVYGFARQSGGQVRIESVENHGTTICLCLPRFRGTAAVAGPGTEAGPAAGTEQGDGETVLLIDDEPVLRALLAEVLADAGYRILEAGDGAAGLRILESGVRVDLLVTDVGLPGGMNGRQVADAARLSRPDLRILFVTGFAENAVLGDGRLGAGMGVLTKPFPVADLTAKVRAMLD